MSVDHTANILEIDNVCFNYGKEEVLHDISFNIHRGDYLGIIGPNGGGKTTLLRIVLGLIKPQCGQIRLFGQDIKNFKDWSKIGYVPQKHVDFQVKFPATVKEVVSMGRFGKRGLFKALNSEDSRHIKRALAAVNMTEYQDRLISDLSGGQQQRVFIARALAGEPQILFLDEPTAGIDFQTQEEFYALLKKLNKDLGLTLVLVSHDIGVIASEVTEVACINKKLIYYGQLQELRKKHLLDIFYGEGISHLAHQH
ncbi:zinc ABC transporter ATP-binding protein [Candidatus Daviesbacteria bacterium RIFCSPHIGHO2_01_FULL_44_29]|uniref:Zinc ABC transporter ATP-binding protein n=1 Tax=Candidatus Daviesbacteria bacterium RIFCSPHIGHO2_02_FULL_43_12 TaxID=1797776 RepID=A0A1F5KGV2_9BACT|nr:MAG: zinc ABC transporter ATP-binding protein [Candidatus Daviesbacteria bacterium RIFCSPHIGHO2_01_FULL_44_29]OGE40064.1 MAG: zinc ABC transporter ATP-binding protein [Candidatus Daviesbacteria bacterium RIFCSPHIGHO2_02_FULL_43_12]OGE41454.1 MAG: zinc ABC transporter ATP-binding protein [Candidatus Daviesbacteria bacterium RIFCSPHIGHO2_12_FULL_47_45]OGE70256.1 MAG: zinc ABC transporter ATP-binding protein [Candidatus Daviesbacteria bacterium RIFCSPLOWO2_01_FULL_43_15]